MPEQAKQQQQQQEQSANEDQQQSLNINEILAALNTVQLEINKWNQLSATLTKCALLLDTILKQNQQTEDQLSTSDVQTDPVKVTPEAPKN